MQLICSTSSEQQSPWSFLRPVYNYIPMDTDPPRRLAPVGSGFICRSVDFPFSWYALRHSGERLLSRVNAMPNGRTYYTISTARQFLLSSNTYKVWPHHENSTGHRYEAHYWIWNGISCSPSKYTPVRQRIESEALVRSEIALTTSNMVVAWKTWC